MPFPAEFRFSSEHDFIQRFLIRLLNRLGFSVVNSHGVTEFGRDLIFAEFDRFGDIRYHGLQAKYTASISKTDSHGLVEECKEAFVNPFKHPNTGEDHNISSFYAVNGGDISETARTHFFNSLREFGANARLMDGKHLLSLDRRASFARGESIGEAMTGLILEVRMNRQLMVGAITIWNAYLADQNNPLPVERLRGFAISNFLARPIGQSNFDLDNMVRYSLYTEKFKGITDYCLMGMSSSENKRTLISHLVDDSANFYLWGNEIEAQARDVLLQLRPITGL